MRRKIIPYNPKLKELARELRKNCPSSEKKLWRMLKGKQMRGYDFHRQKPIDRYVVDFFCHELMLAIEIDGVSHDFREEADKQRQQKLESLGVRFLRFRDEEVYYYFEQVLKKIEKWIEENES